MKYQEESCLQFSPSEQTFALATGANIALIDASSGKITTTLDVSCHTQCHLVWLSENRLLAWGDAGTLTLWDAKMGTMLDETDENYSYCTTLTAIPSEDTDTFYAAFETIGNTNYLIETLWQISSEDRLLTCLQLQDATVTLTGNEIFLEDYGQETYGFYRIYTLDELIERGHSLLSSVS